GSISWTASTSPRPEMSGSRRGSPRRSRRGADPARNVLLSRPAVAVDQARPLRVCLVVPYDLADEGGVKRHVEHLAESLRQMGDEVTIAGPLREGEAAVHTRGFGGVVNIPANGAANYTA